ncbi:hypothetical protein WH47_06869 [Habropoda laboriosa]|uniref:Uncharacterized protein n=1 Tax=Habropoda laboriosa TaxID=597456 RepID=A0A0L7QQ92_9HYME|nr:hypothetical protein WH47_06869 [Habropoda laboriosa]
MRGLIVVVVLSYITSLSYTFPLPEENACDKWLNVTANSTAHQQIYDEIKNMSPQVRTKLCAIALRDLEESERSAVSSGTETEDGTRRPGVDAATDTDDDDEIDEEVLGGLIALSIKSVFAYVYRKAIRKWLTSRHWCRKKKAAAPAETAERQPVNTEDTNFSEVEL